MLFNLLYATILVAKKIKKNHTGGAAGSAISVARLRKIA